MATPSKQTTPQAPAVHKGKARKVMITCAVTGSIHTPSMSPYLPITAQQIADAAIGAAEAGAALVHLHARDEKTGKPIHTPEAFHPFLKVIKQRTDAVLNITTGGAPTMSIDERLLPCAVLKPEVASLNMGSMNFGLYPMLERFKEFKHDWGKPFLKPPTIASSRTPSRISRTFSHAVPPTTHVLRSSATTSATLHPAPLR